MTPFDVLSTIRSAGGCVVVEDGDLRVIAPPNTLTPEAVVVLRENKAALLGILPNAERETIGWVENLTPGRAAVVVESARQEWTRLVEQDEPVVIQVEIVGNELLLHCPTSEIAAKIETGRERIDRVLAEIHPIDADHDLSTWEEAVEPIPCATCGSIMAWWDFTDRRHCMICEPIGRLLTEAARLRRKAHKGVPSRS
jgi:hypothetical protein